MTIELMRVSDDEAGLLAMEFDVVCYTVDGREFTVRCDAMASIGGSIIYFVLGIGSKYLFLFYCKRCKRDHRRKE